MVHWLQLIEKKDAQLAYVLCVGLVIFQAAREAAGPHEELTCGGVVAVRFLSRESFAGDLLQQAFANADTWNGKGAQIQVSAYGDERDGRNAHHVGAIAAHS